MEPQWKQVDEIVAEALTLEEAERPSFIQQACRDNTDLRQEVDALLAVDTSALSRIDRPVFKLLTDGPESSSNTIGPYEIEGELGRGGMAVVYRARRTDGTDSRPVAIKVLKRGMDTDEIVRRFRREGNILAALRHPHIARVFGGGVTTDQRPYLVMELVEGQPIDQYCDQHRLTIWERARLLLPVCSAIGYAHSNLIVHRDLKPSNILVTEEGVPKVLDFGISKLLDPATTSPLTMTATGLRLMTPEYAAPEQLAMAPISTATDVYSLGVVLFELLTRQRPFKRGEDPSGFLKDVLERQPVRPSTLLLRRQARLVAPDLDPIVLKALRKEPPGRYTSAGDLAQDLQFFLDGRPVGARAGSFRYRTSKLIQRRYREIFVATVLLLIIIGVGIDRESSRREIVTERNKAVAVQDFLTKLFTNADPYNQTTGETLTVDLLIEQGLSVIQELDNFPQGKATILKVLGSYYGNSGKFDKALNLVEESTELFRRSLPSGHILTAQSEILLSDIYTQLEEVEKSEAILRRVLRSFEQSRSPHEENRLEARISLGKSLIQQKRWKEAEEIYLLALADTKRLPMTSLSIRSKRIEVWLFLGILLKSQQKFDDAKSYLDQSLGSCETEWAENDVRCLYILGIISEVTFGKGDHNEAINLMRRVVTRTRQRAGTNSALGEALSRLGKALKEAGHFADSAKALQEAEDVFLEIYGPEHSSTRECQRLLETLPQSE